MMLLDDVSLKAAQNNDDVYKVCNVSAFVEGPECEGPVPDEVAMFSLRYCAIGRLIIYFPRLISRLALLTMKWISGFCFE